MNYVSLANYKDTELNKKFPFDNELNKISQEREDRKA